MSKPNPSGGPLSPMARAVSADLLTSPLVRCFLAVAQARSFRGASERLRIAASAIHRQVGLLEDQLAVALFTRKRGREGVRLTSAGEQLLYRLQLATHQVDMGLQEIDRLRGSASGTVVVGTTDVLAQDLFPAVLAGFREAHSKIAVELQVLSRRQLIEALGDGRLDVALGFELPLQLSFKVLAEFPMPTCAVVPRGHALAEKRQTTLGECAQFPLALALEGDSMQQMLTQMNVDLRSRPNVVLRSNSFSMMRSAAAAGIAITIQTRLPGAFATREPGLVYVPLKAKTARYSVLSCCILASRRQSMEASGFANHLIRALAQELGAPAEA
jgi:DNA-binding transcriptional LysR family regulator